MAEQKIGLSLSMCVHDVINGQVGEDEIHAIVAGTAVETPEDMDELVESYRDTCWRDNPDMCEELARRLFDNGRVYQPRLEGKPAPKPVPLHWLGVVENWQEAYPKFIG
jgi:hypothetical protein